MLHPLWGSDTEFKMLGTLVDSALTFRPCIEGILKKCRPKIRGIVRLRHIYSASELLAQFKAHVWPHIEYSSGAIILACITQRRRLDSMQRGFLHKLGMDEVSAFLQHRFAPPCLRRTIGLLSFLHKRVLGLCHPALLSALPFMSGIVVTRRYHTRMLADFRNVVTHRWCLYNRSLYNYIRVYNTLPQDVVDATTVANFQSKLTLLCKQRAESGDENWIDSLQCPADTAEWLHPDPPPMD